MSNSTLTVLFCFTHMIIYLGAALTMDLTVPANMALGSWLILMVMSPYLMQFWGVLGPSWLWSAYLMWMGTAFFLFLGGLASLITGAFTGFREAEPVFWTGVALTPFIMGYGFLKARTPQLREYILETASLPESVGEIRVLAFSDLHLGQFENGGRLDRIWKLLQSVEADVIVAVGDILDYGRHTAADLPKQAAMLQKLKAPLGKFAVLGNHEFYAGVERSLEFLKGAGFRVLRNETADLGRAGHVAGVDDAMFGVKHRDASAELTALRDVERRGFTLLLKHRPEVETDALGLFDLQLSGHTHGGQVYPWAFIDNWIYPYFRGWYDLPQGGRLLVTRGVGTWGPPVRIGAPAEAALIHIRNAARSGEGNAARPA